jgi:hypothetical protein
VTRSFRLLAVVVLFLALTLSSAQNAFAPTPVPQELVYDDGSANGSISIYPPNGFAVRFSLPSGWSSAKVLTARYNLAQSAGAPFTVRIVGQDRATDLTPPFTATPSVDGWFDVDLAAKNIFVTNDFYVVLKVQDAAGNPWLATDNTDFQSRSWYAQAGSWVQELHDNFMIRAVVEQPSLELYYDDGTGESGFLSFNVGTMYAVRFSLPSGWSSANLAGFMFYIYDPGSVTVRIYGSLTTGCNGVELQNFPMTFNGRSWNAQTGLSGITVAGDFCVAAEYTVGEGYPSYYLDSIVSPEVNPQRSWVYSTSTGTWALISPAQPGTLMFRAWVEEQSTGTIAVDKVTDPSGDPASFSFTTTGTGYNGFSLTDADPANNQKLSPGSYSVAETVPAGWALNAHCFVQPGGTSTWAVDSQNSAKLNINLVAGDTVACAFTNTKQTTSFLAKTTDGAELHVRVVVDWKYWKPQTTPFSMDSLGRHTFAAQRTVTAGGVSYSFVRWEDEAGVVVSTSPTFTVNLQSAKTFTAVYAKASYKLTVNVLDSSTHKPIAGATVTLDGVKVGSTDSYGKLVIQGVSSGNHQVVIHKTGYKDYTTTINITSNKTLSVNLNKI